MSAQHRASLREGRVTGVPCGGKPIDPDLPPHDELKKARWIQDPLFRALPYRPIVSHRRVRENATEVRNVHTLFRRSFPLPQGRPASAVLSITADDAYALYVNGSFVGCGPAQAPLFAYPYNRWDVAALLLPGQVNCIGVHVYYQGLFNLAYMSADNMEGLLVQLDVECVDGARVSVATDATWRFHRSEARKGERAWGYETQLSEDIDLRLWEPDWIKPSFDDSSWQRPFVAANPWPPAYNIVPQRIPPVEFRTVAPRSVKELAPGRWVIDFGSELVGTTVFTVTGPSGHAVEIRHAEEMGEDGGIRFALRANCTYQETVILSGRERETIEFFEYKGFRYAEVVNWPGVLRPQDVHARIRHYPFPEDACAFRTSDAVLDDVWELCRNGVKHGTQETYLDCPTREKGGFVGDGFVTAPSHLVLTGDARIFRKFLRDIADSARQYPGLLGHVPTYVAAELLDYSILWPLMLERYHDWTGDAAFLRETEHVQDGLLESLGESEDGDGFLRAPVNALFPQIPSILVDWPTNLRDGYDFDRAASGVCTLANMQYLGCLESCARLYGLLGRPDAAASASRKADRLRRSIVEKLFDARTGLFLDAEGSTHSSFHANVLPLTFSVEPPGGYGPILSFLREKRICCGVYFAWFLLEGLYNRNEGDFAYDLMSSDDASSWRSMIAAGATTCMEVWSPEQKKNASFCHPWSSAPITMVAHRLLGLNPGSPGWRSVRFAPRPPAALADAEVSFRTPVGTMGAGYVRRGGETVYGLRLPADMPVSFEFAGVRADVTVDGRRQSFREERDRFGVPVLRAEAFLPSGTHEVRTGGA